MIYSVSVHIYEDGGYYLNPPENFVNIGFNKGGDNMMIFPTNLVRKAKFKIGSAESVNDGNAFVDDEEGGFYNVSINKNRNYYIIKFVKIT